MNEHAKIRPPRSAEVIAAFDLDTWGDTDDGQPHHAFLCAGEDETSAVAYIPPCACYWPMNSACPRTKIMLAGRAFFNSLTIVERAPPKTRARRLKRR